VEFRPFLGKSNPNGSRDAARSFALAVLEDSRALIAALKIQRWEVLKWTVTVNATLAAAATALKDKTLTFLILAGFIAIIGIVLIAYYNFRATKIRDRHRRTVCYLRRELFDVNRWIGINVGIAKTTTYDWQELVIFGFAILLSIAPLVLIYLANRGIFPALTG
jgi:hypothetical protein